MRKEGRLCGRRDGGRVAGGYAQTERFETLRVDLEILAELASSLVGRRVGEAREPRVDAGLRLRLLRNGRRSGIRCLVAARVATARTADKRDAHKAVIGRNTQRGSMDAEAAQLVHGAQLLEVVEYVRL